MLITSKIFFSQKYQAFVIVCSLLYLQSYMLHTLSLDSTGPLWDPLLRQEMVFLLRDWFGLAATNFGLGKNVFYDKIRALITYDETGKSFTDGFMIHKSAPQELKDYIHTR